MPAGQTYTFLASQTLTSSATSVTFSSISNAYTDLVLVFQGSGVSGNTLYYQFNNVTTGALYSDIYMFADGTTGAGLHSSQNVLFGAGVNTNQSQQVLHIMNYSNTTTFKTTIQRGNANGTAATVGFIGMFRSTSAISTIKVALDSSFATGSTFNLYGIAAA